jgi:hypothetical protein
MVHRTVLWLNQDAKMNAGATMNTDATTNTDATSKAEEYYWPTQHARAHDVRGFPALIRASVIIFVIVRKAQLSV